MTKIEALESIALTVIRSWSPTEPPSLGDIVDWTRKSAALLQFAYPSAEAEAIDEVCIRLAQRLIPPAKKK